MHRQVKRRVRKRLVTSKEKCRCRCFDVDEVQQKHSGESERFQEDLSELRRGQLAGFITINTYQSKLLL